MGTGTSAVQLAMDDDWELDPPLSQGSQAGSMASSPAKSRVKKRSLKVKSPNGKRAPGKSGSGSVKKGTLDRNCFVCPAKKKANSRFCGVHHPIVECIRTQAKAKGEIATFDDIMYSVNKAKASIEEFQTENPPGKFRKK